MERLINLVKEWDTAMREIDPIMAGLILLLCLCIAWVVHTPRQGIKMGRDTTKVAQLIEDALDEAVERKEISIHYKRYWTNRISRGAGIPDMRTLYRLGKKLHPYQVTDLKERIKYRLTQWVIVDAKDAAVGLFYKIKPNLPAKTPAAPQPLHRESAAARTEFASFFTTKRAA